jgi:LmbE family N-acetylglucosaminyl deacetylase
VTGNTLGVFYGSGYINHPDHRAAAEYAVYAVFPSAGTRLIFTDLLDEGFEPHNVTNLYIHGVEKPDTWIDISTSIDKKIAALRKHASQLGSWDPEQMIRKWASEEGQGPGLEYAEAFKVMDLSDYKSDL